MSEDENNVVDITPVYTGYVATIKADRQGMKKRVKAHMEELIIALCKEVPGIDRLQLNTDPDFENSIGRIAEVCCKLIDKHED